MTKKCKNCGKEKEMKDFHKAPKNKDQRANTCIECVSEDRKIKYQKEPELHIWRAMISRCYNEKDRKYKYYGGRGITVCDRWLKSYKNFVKDVGKRPAANLTIDRIDNDEGYKPGNVRWATHQEQMLNKRILNNKSGAVGVRQHHNSKRWVAEIRINGQYHHLGSFGTFEEAKKAREETSKNTIQCSKCSIIKLRKDFTNNKSRPNGKHPWCKKCMSERRKKDRNRIKKYNQEYYLKVTKDKRSKNVTTSKKAKN